MSKWFDIKDIGRIQLELTNYCNAACPMCDRHETAFMPPNSTMGKVELNSKSLSLAQIKETFSGYEWESLESVHYCGCLDEPTINPEMIEITEFFLSLNDKLKVWIATNGGTRSDEFWAKLGRLSKQTGNRVVTIYGIDGLRENNHFYRRNVNWDKLERNFRTYIANGGFAIWKCIIFPYNIDMLEKIRDTALDEGFDNFVLIKTARSPDYIGEEDLKLLSFGDDPVVIPEWYERENSRDSVQGNDQVKLQEMEYEAPRVRCIAKPNSMDKRFHPTGANIYVDYKGQVTPCCWTGNPFKLMDMQEKALRERGIDRKTHNIAHYSLQEILDGPFWEFIHDEFEVTTMCVNKCRKFKGDIWL